MKVNQLTDKKMNNSIVAFMPIRLNSQRIKDKSIIQIYGRPMFCWALETLSNLNIPTYVYTNEIDRLKREMDFQSSNIHFLQRPKYLDKHSTTGIQIYKEFANQVNADVYLLTHCTSPFIKLSTYQKVVKAVVSGDYDSSCTVERKQTFCWFKDKRLNFSIPRQKTQEVEPIFVETSAAYCYKKQVLDDGDRTGEKNCFIETSGLECIDIDEEKDLEIFYIKEKKNV